MTMTLVQYVLPVLFGLAIASAVVGVRWLRNPSNRVQQRLRRIGGNRQEASSSPYAGMSRPLHPLLRPITLLSWLLPGQSGSQLLRWELASAGYRHEKAGRVFVGFRVLATVVPAFAALHLTSTYTALIRNEVLVLTGVVALVGFMAPWMVLRALQARRRDEIVRALPDALDLLVICVEAGQGLNAALLSVSQESSLHSQPMSEELKLVNMEMATGVKRTEALRNLARRTAIDDVRGLVAVLVQSDKFGTSIAQALRTHADSLRVRRRQRAEEAARKTPVKMLFPLIFCIFPALLVVMLAPGMLQLIDALKGVNQ